MSNYSQITLTSDDEYSGLINPKNTHGSFRTVFDHDLTFESAECALTKLTFYNAFNNITSANNTVYAERFRPYTVVKEAASGRETRLFTTTTEKEEPPEVWEFKLPVCEVRTPTDFVDIFSEAGKRSIPWWKEVARKGKEGHLLMIRPQTLYPHEGKVRYGIANYVSVYIHSNIVRMMGMTELIEKADEHQHLRNPTVPNTHIMINDINTLLGFAKSTYDMGKFKPKLRVCSDLIRPTRVYGHTMMPMLVEKHTQNEEGELVEYTPHHLTFFPLRQTNVTTAEVNIYDERGDLVSFKRGPTSIEVLVRDKQYTHNQL